MEEQSSRGGRERGSQACDGPVGLAVQVRNKACPFLCLRQEALKGFEGEAQDLPYHLERIKEITKLA